MTYKGSVRKFLERLGSGEVKVWTHCANLAEIGKLDKREVLEYLRTCLTEHVIPELEEKKNIYILSSMTKLQSERMQKPSRYYENIMIKLNDAYNALRVIDEGMGTLTYKGKTLKISNSE